MQLRQISSNLGADLGDLAAMRTDTAASTDEYALVAHGLGVRLSVQIRGCADGAEARMNKPPPWTPYEFGN